MARQGGVASAVVLAVAILALGQHTVRSAHSVHPSQSAQVDGQQAVVLKWAKLIGDELRNFANNATRYQRLHESFRGARVAVRNETKILKSVALNVEKLMQRRMAQVQEIRRAAERLGAATDYHRLEVPQPYLGVKDQETTEAPTPPPTKKPKLPVWVRATVGPSTTPRPTTPTTTLKPWLTHVDAFPGGSLVNETLSAVHVPATVYDGRFINLTLDAEEINSTGAEVQQVIELTSALDEVFVRNAKEDPSTSWQFFAHHTGVMRQFPASKWNTIYQEDYYDARLRPWYLGAATSPKDVVILLDNSGSISMTEPSILTKLVVHNILDTLGPDDFVSVLLFNNTITPLFPGLDETLIPATSAHVRELQHALEDIRPTGMANLSQALESAFVLLEKYRRRSLGAACNQAVMLVTDLVPEHEEELFRTHNRPELDYPGQTHARVFTFIVGDWAQGPPREAQWMACANMGWHMHIWKYQQGGVMAYIPVMARPLVLAGRHPVHWSNVYADVTVPGMTDLLWAEMERDEQLRKVTPFCFKHAELHPPDKQHYLRSVAEDRKLGQSEEYVITVSVPVRNISQEGTNNGDLLGVAGIDVAIQQITRMIPQYKLGVNAYIFMVTNNGLVVFHPDLRPRFNGILKPGFNSIDMTEVEQEDAPQPSKSLWEFRQLIVNQTTGTVVLTIRQTYDNFYRVSRWSRRYFFRGLADTPYSLVMAVPADYGGHRIQPPSEAGVSGEKLLNSLRGDHGVGAASGGRGWAVHPDWTYCPCNCRRPGRSGLPFIDRPDQPCGSDADRELAVALSHDAVATRWWFADAVQDRSSSLLERWEVSTVFMSTHSALTRWIVLPRNSLPRDDTKAPVGIRGPDEVWYRRAVEAATAAASRESAQAVHWVVSVPLVDEPGADVYSEYNAAYDPDDPLAARRAGLGDDWAGTHGPDHDADLGGANFTRNIHGADARKRAQQKMADKVRAKEVTATAAVKTGKIPAAVAGLRFPQGKLQELFLTITTTLSCPGASRGTACGETCASDGLDCFLLDEHGIVVADESGLTAGQPLARVRPGLMTHLEKEHVFLRVAVRDHQAVCRRGPDQEDVKSAAPPQARWRAGPSWVGAGAALAALLWQRHHAAASPEPATALLLAGAQLALGAKQPDSILSPEMVRTGLEPFRVHKTVLQLCAVTLDRHLVGPGLKQHHHTPFACDGRPFAAAAVPGTNLVLVAALSACPDPGQTSPIKAEPREVPRDGPGLRKAWPRRRPASCFRDHVGERNITLCGGARHAGGVPASGLGAMLAFAVLLYAA